MSFRQTCFTDEFNPKSDLSSILVFFCELKLAIIHNLSHVNANRDLNTVLSARVCDKARACRKARWDLNKLLRLFVRILVF
jgi:hypothetical protein